MNYILRQSTASQEIMFGPILDSTDLSAETGLTIANTDIKIFKAGATSEASKNSGGATHIAAGRYYCVLDATDTDTIGSGEINVAISATLPVKVGFTILAAAVYDVLFGTTAPATVSNITGGTITTVTNVTNAPTSGDLTATMKASVNAEVDAAISDAALATAANLATVAGYLDTEIAAILADTNELQTDWANGGRLDLIVDAILDDTDLIDDGTSGLAKIATDVAAILVDTGTTLQGDVTAILADTNELQTDWANGGRLDLILDARASQASVDNLPTNSELATALGTADDAVLAAIAALNDPTAASIADAVWDETLSGHLGAGSTGEALNAAGAAGDPWTTTLPGAYTGSQAGAILADLPTNAELATALASADDATLAAIAALNNLSAAQVNAEVDTALADYDGPTNTEMVAAFTQIKGATWATTDTLEAIRDRGDAAWVTATGFSTLDEAGVRTAVGLGSANLDTQLGDLPTNAELATSQAAADDATLAAIAALNNLSAAQVNAEVDTAIADASLATAANLATVAGYLDTEIAAILENTGTTIPALIAALNDLSANDILDASNGVETGVTLRQATRLILAAVAGKLSGAATSTIVIRDVNDTVSRITATVDSDGNRSAVTHNVS